MDLRYVPARSCPPNISRTKYGQGVGARMRRYLQLILAITLLTIFGTLMGWAQIPARTSVQVRITENLSSETATVGQQFRGVLAVPITANGRTVFPKDAAITGEVVKIERSGRLSTP